MPTAAGFGYQAGGNISPSVFVMLSTTADFTILQATAGAKLIGIMHKGTHRAPYGALDDGFAAVSGESVRIFVPEEVAPLTLGGTVTAFDRLKATTGGVGITAGSGDEYGAIALEQGISGETIRVLVVLGKLP